MFPPSFYTALFTASSRWLASLIAVSLVAGSAHAQMGVLPSQTGRFMDELRERSGQSKIVDPLGEDRAALEDGRPAIRLYVLRPQSSFADRLAEDNPFGTGHYQMGRDFQFLQQISPA